VRHRMTRRRQGSGLAAEAVAVSESGCGRKTGQRRALPLRQRATVALNVVRGEAVRPQIDIATRLRHTSIGASSNSWAHAHGVARRARLALGGIASSVS
jgi:hypothetical protein